MKISVIIPTFNSELLIKSVINSVLIQTYNNIEIIIIDNMSTDETLSIIKSIQTDKIKIYSIDNNGIIAKSRNYGIKKSTGDLIAFLDSDDIWYKDRLKKIEEAASKNCEHQVFTTNEMVVYNSEKKKKILSYGPYEKNFYKKLLLYGNRLSTSATVIRKKFLVENNLEFSENEIYNTAEDYDLWLKIANLGARFYFINEVLGECNINEKNESRKIDYHYKNIRNVLINHAINIQTFCNDKKKLQIDLELKVHLQKCKALIIKNKNKESIILLINCIKTYPYTTLKILINYILK